MKLGLIILLTVLTHLAFTGSRMAASLYALRLGASTFTVGVLIALYALLPMLLAVAAGRMIDRVGPYKPMLWSGIVFIGGLLLPALFGGMTALFIAATVVGTAFMVYHVALSNVVASLGAPESRAVAFSWLALGYSTGGFCGPLIAGFSIDYTSFRWAFVLLAIPPIVSMLPLLHARRWFPQTVETKSGGGARGRIVELLRIPELRGAFIASGLLAMGWDLYMYIMPIYGTRIGLAATTIGVIMGAFAAATFVVRLVMPAVARRVSAWPVILTALAISGTAYLLLPFAKGMPLLMALSFLLGIGLGCAQPMIMALLYGASPPGREGEVVGVRSTMLNASHTFLPLIFGALGATLGMGTVFWSMAVCLLGGVGYAWRRMKPH